MTTATAPAGGSVGVGALDRVPPPLLLAGSALSVQTGAAVATRLFPALGVFGVLGLRMGVGALVVVLVTRAWRTPPRGRARGLVLVFAATLSVMNVLFYLSLERIPLGVAVALELVGPLAVAVGARSAASRGPGAARAEALWAALAVAGVGVLVVPGALAQSRAAGALDPLGVLFVLGAGACWAAYILLGSRLGRMMPPAAGLGWAMTAGTVVLAPVAALSAGRTLVEPHHLLTGAAVGVLSAAVPYGVELATMRRTGPRAFGIMMSLEPAAALLAGLVVAAQHPSALALVGIALVTAASLGAGWRTPAVAADLPRPQPPRG